MKILIVDDDAVDRKAIVKSIHIDGVEIQESKNGNEFLDLCESQEFDCVIMDHMLPDWKSIDLIQEVENRGLLFPVIVMTGQGDEKLAVCLMKNSMVYDYLVKGEQLEEITNSILNATEDMSLKRKSLLAAQELNDRISKKIEDADIKV